jgi:hypothetical protein
MSSQIFTFAVFLLVLGRLERLSSSTDSQLALKREYHSKPAIQLKECTPKASRNILRVSVADLSNTTLNLMQTRCLIFAIHRRQNEI